MIIIPSYTSIKIKKTKYNKKQLIFISEYDKQNFEFKLMNIY